MTNAKPLIAGNWKMHGLRADAVALAEAVAADAAASADVCEVAVFPPFTALEAVGSVLSGSPVALGGQDCHEAEAGAHTSCISAAMLADLGCRYVILGHSERRHGRRETSETVHDKAKAAFRAGLTPIVCVGETRAQRIRGMTVDAIIDQVYASVPDAEGPMMFAYEPVWAIGTGNRAAVLRMGRGCRGPECLRRGAGLGDRHRQYGHGRGYCPGPRLARPPAPRTRPGLRRQSHPVRRLGQTGQRRRDPGRRGGRWPAGRRRQPERRHLRGDHSRGGVGAAAATFGFGGPAETISAYPNPIVSFQLFGRHCRRMLDQALDQALAGAILPG